MAGESARASARRQREKAERLLRSAELWERGADGEEATGSVLARLPADTWTVFHDIRWPGRRFANIDHVVVGPPGVFVIDSKNWSGRIQVDCDVLRQNGRQRESAVAGAADAAIALGQLLSTIDVSRVHPVLCFVRDEPVTGWARDVMVCSTATLEQMLLSRPASFVPMRVRGIVTEVDAVIRAAAAAPAVSPSRRASAPGAGRPRPGRTPGRSGRAGQQLVRRLVGALLMTGLFAAGLAYALPQVQQGIVDTQVAPPEDPCATVNATYPHGVGRPGAEDAVDGEAARVRRYAVRPKVYREHRALDVDRDGIACER